MAITDLTGYTWVGNESVVFVSEGTRFNINATLYSANDDVVSTTFLRFSSMPAPPKNTFYELEISTTGFSTIFSGMSIYEGFNSTIMSTKGGYQESAGSQFSKMLITGGTDVTNATAIQWFQNNGTLTPPVTGYSITYHSDGGTPTPEDLTGQTALPDPLPTISKSNYIFNGWYLDSTFETPAVAGATIFANTDLYAKFTEDTRIHCDLTQLAGWADLAAGQHTITVKAKASGYRDSEPSTGVTVTKVAAYQYTQEGSVVTLTNAPYSQTGSEVTIL